MMFYFIQSQFRLFISAHDGVKYTLRLISMKQFYSEAPFYFHFNLQLLFQSDALIQLFGRT